MASDSQRHVSLRINIFLISLPFSTNNQYLKLNVLDIVFNFIIVLQ